MKNASFSSRDAERLALSRKTIEFGGREYWSPDYAEWFAQSGPVSLVRTNRKSPHCITVTGCDGSTYDVHALPNLRREGLTKRKKQKKQQGPHDRNAAGTPLRPEQSGLPWYVKVALERPSYCTLKKTFRLCLAMSVDGSGGRLRMPSYSTFLQHVRIAENSISIARRPLCRPRDCWTENSSECIASAADFVR